MLFCLYPMQFPSDRFFFSRILQPLSNSRGVLPPFCFLFCSSFIDNLYTQTKFESKHSNVQWNVFKGVYFYWEKSTPQFKLELISGDYFFPCGSKFFSGKYYSESTFFPGNYYSGSNFFRGVSIYGYTGKYGSEETRDLVYFM